MASPTPSYAHVGLGLALLAAAFPVRIFGSFPFVQSVSLLDVALVLAAGGLVLRAAAGQRIVFGDPRLFALLSVLPALSMLSLFWTQDFAATFVDVATYLEALLAYVYVLTQTDGVPGDTIVKWLRWFTYALLVAPILLLLHVHGFAPQEPGLKQSSGDYLSYYSRFSHPFIGRSNNLATVLAMVVPVLLYWGVKHHQRATLVAGITGLVAIALTVSRGVMLALLIGVVVVALKRGVHLPEASRRLIGIGLAGTLGALLVAAGLLYRYNVDTKMFIGERLSLSNVTLRETRLTDGLQELWRQPFLGYGAGTLPNQNEAIFGGVHNTFLQQLLSYGVLLGSLAILAMVETVRFFLGSARGLRLAIGVTLLAQLLSYMVESSFEGTTLRVLIYLLLGMLVGLLRAASTDPIEVAVAPLEEARHAGQ